MESKTPDTTGFITTHKFNKLSKTKVEATKTLASKSTMMTAFTLGRKQRKIKRLKTFDSGFLLLVKIP